jgi:hypothetical protein
VGNIFNVLDIYLILITINTLYAILESIPDRSTPSIYNTLKSIFKKLKIKSLESNNEADFVSKPVLKYLKEKGVDYYVVSEQRRNNLNIIGMLNRTLRDWMRKNKSMTTLRFASSSRHTTEQYTKQQKYRHYRGRIIKTLKYSTLLIQSINQTK